MLRNKRSLTPRRCIYSTDIYPSIYICNQPRNIRHRDKNEEKEKKGREKKGERNGTKGGWFTFPLRPAPFLDLATWNACTLYASYSSYSSSRTIVAKLGNLCVFWYSHSRFIFFSSPSLSPFFPSFSSTGIAKILDSGKPSKATLALQITSWDRRAPTTATLINLCLWSHKNALDSWSSYTHARTYTFHECLWKWESG